MYTFCGHTLRVKIISIFSLGPFEEWPASVLAGSESARFIQLSILALACMELRVSESVSQVLIFPMKENNSAVTDKMGGQAEAGFPRGRSS